MMTDYFFVAGFNPAEVIQDIYEVLSGETVVANLSASCDKAQTTITADTPAGWTRRFMTWDGNNTPPLAAAIVLSSPIVGEPTKEKYAVIDIRTVSSDQDIYLVTSETYPALTGSNPITVLPGSNPTPYSATTTKLADNLAAGRLMIAANAGMIMLRPRPPSNEQASEMFFEFTPMVPWYELGVDTRFTPYCTAINNPYGITTGGSYVTAQYFGVPRTLDMQNSDIVQDRLLIGRVGVTGAEWDQQNAVQSANTYALSTSALMPTDTETGFALMPIYIHNYRSVGGILGNISDKANVWWMNERVTPEYSVFTVDGQDFIAVSISISDGGTGIGYPTVRLAVPNG